VTAKGTLPPLPPSPATSRFEQSTVRHMPPQQKPSIPVAPPAEPQHQDAYEDYDDQYVETYSTTKGSMIQQKLQEQIDDDDLPDTTMLDSVILPAIASLFPRVNSQEARVALSALQRAFTEAERIIPGVTLELVNEIVDSVEHVEEDDR